ncbi:uncharacterized protein RCH25_019395 [Pelodytes ibericus]
MHSSLKEFECSKCGKCFFTMTDLTLHKFIHTGEKPFTCSECGKSFTQKSHLTQHEMIHTVIKPFVCTECEKCFTYRSALYLHKRIHTGEKPFLCSECGKGFTTKTDLTQHEMIHTGVKPFVCSECEKCFNKSSHLIQHERIHTGEKPFVCSECGKCFTQKTSLTQHEISHTGIKPFACTECEKCFTYRSTLYLHKRIHSREKLCPFSCSECEKCFTTKSSLNGHKRIHTGVKPFVCSECGRCFTQKTSLTQHEMIHTGVKPFACTECPKTAITDGITCWNWLHQPPNLPTQLWIDVQKKLEMPQKVKSLDISSLRVRLYSSLLQATPSWSPTDSESSSGDSDTALEETQALKTPGYTSIRLQGPRGFPTGYNHAPEIDAVLSKQPVNYKNALLQLYEDLPSETIHWCRSMATATSHLRINKVKYHWGLPDSLIVNNDGKSITIVDFSEALGLQRDLNLPPMPSYSAVPLTATDGH